METNPKFSHLAIILWLGFSIWLLSNLQAIPFHPDESTQIFMSSDFAGFFADPAKLIYNGEKDDLRQHYRLVDAPLTRYLIGLGRRLANLPGLAADWNWSFTWEQNQAAGALPDARLLLVARLSTAILAPLSLLLAYRIGKKLAGETCGLVTMILLGSNALFLLHTRRAMAESGLVLGVLFVLWCLTLAQEKPWLAGVALALAINAKQSALALLPVVMIAVCLIPGEVPGRFRKITQNLAWMLATLGVITLALNPFLWGRPVAAAQTALGERQLLVKRQVDMIRSISPEQVLDDSGKTGVGADCQPVSDAPSLRRGGQLPFGNRRHQHSLPGFTGQPAIPQPAGSRAGDGPDALGAACTAAEQPPPAAKGPSVCLAAGACLWSADSFSGAGRSPPLAALRNAPDPGCLPGLPGTGVAQIIDGLLAFSQGTYLRG